MDKGQTTKIKVKTKDPEDGNYYAVIDGKYYEMNFRNSQLTIEREAKIPEDNTEEQAEIEVETGYDTTIVTNIQINQTEKTIEITSGEKYDNITLTIKYGDKTATCKVTVEKSESDWTKIAEVAKLVAEDSTITKDIKTIIKGGMTITVGDSFYVKYNGDIKEVMVLGFKHDLLTNPSEAYGNGTTASMAGITFKFVEALGGHLMSANKSNPGSWDNCDMRRYLNGTNLDSDNNLFGTGKFSNVFENSIKQVEKDCCNRESKTVAPCSDKLWLISEVEQYGGTKHGVGKEGSIYKYYADGGKWRYSYGERKLEVHVAEDPIEYLRADFLYL